MKRRAFTGALGAALAVGVSASPRSKPDAARIVVGQSAPLTGPASELGRQFADDFFAPAETISGPGSVPSGLKERAKAAVFAAASPLL